MVVSWDQTNNPIYGMAVYTRLLADNLHRATNY